MAYDPTQEVRFAVVMYGGVSLAIYINGIAQELLHAVRATADLPDSQLAGTEQVYRQIGRLLYHGREPGDPAPPGSDLRTRIVVDVLSGTSAGGINAVFLAKALAQKNKDLARLKQMWLNDADIDTLLNDRNSDLGKYPSLEPKTSLLNSQRMYGLLLKAFTDMDTAERDAGGAPRADKIDLFVTATDLNGLEAPIELTDASVDERIHRMVFHFETEKGDDGGHFTSRYNPMLAFAARCTSSFPTAFEPMKFSSIQPPLSAEQQKLFETFFERYVAMGADYRSRPFADGGYLDNKPFSYAIDAIQYRDADRPVVRNLLYVDPFPEYASDQVFRENFDFVENSLAAATGLPRYETIRADVDRINQRNRIQIRLQRLRERVERDRPPLVAPLSPGDFINGDLADMVKHYGDSYGPYHHQKIFAVTDWLALVATRVLGHNEDSDEYRAVRHLVRAWRERHYAPYREPGKEPENKFLLRYDIDYRLRRLNYLEREIDDRLKKPDSEEAAAALKKRRVIIETQLSRLRSAQRTLEARLKGPLSASLGTTAQTVTDEDLAAILTPSSDQDRRRVAAAIYQQKNLVIETLAGELERQLRIEFTAVSAAVADALDPAKLPDDAGLEERTLTISLWKRFLAFEIHDILTLQFLEGTGLKESSQIGVFRVSPADTGLKPRNVARGDRKLAGTAVGNFGAFLSKGWRENDMLWGRLDGAERIITALLPDQADADLRGRLVLEAQRLVLEEEFNPSSNDRLLDWLVRYVHDRVEPGTNETQLTAQIKEVIAQQVAGGNYVDFIRSYYSIPPGPPPRDALSWAARATQILGEMFQGLTGAGPVQTTGARLKLAGAVLTRVVAFALPDSLGRVLVRHWLLLIALASLVLILAGPFVSKEVASIGWTALGLTGVLLVASVLLGDYLSGRGWLKGAGRFALLALVALAAALAGIGAGTVWNWVAQHQDWFTNTLPLLWQKVAG